MEGQGKASELITNVRWNLLEDSSLTPKSQEKKKNHMVIVDSD